MRKTKLFLLMAAMLLCCVTRISAEIILTEEDGLLATTSTNSAGTLQYEFTSDLFTLDEATNTLYFTFLRGKSKSGATPMDYSGYPYVALAEFFLYDGEGNEIALSASNFSTNAQEPTEGPITNICDDDRTSFWHSTWSSGVGDYHYLKITLPAGQELTEFKFGYITRYTSQCLPSVIHVGTTNDNISFSLSGTHGENINWSFIDGNLIVEGTGTLDGNSIGLGGIKSVEIKEGITAIGENAFSDCSSLTSITIPEGVTSIGSSAFSGCSSLTAITIPEGVTSIENSAFYGCSSLATITIPEGVTSIGSSAFSGCSSLTAINIPEGVTSIGYGAFFGCSSLASITIPEGVTSIGACAFDNCRSLTAITIPEGVTSIGYGAFDNCRSLTSITLPEGVTSIGEHAFCDCRSLTAITIPESVTSIGDGAFANCSSLTSITIPEGVTSIGSSAFNGCSLESITVDADNTVYDSRNGCNAIIETSSNTLITGCAKTVIPASVTSIGSSAFSDCSSLTTITIPEGVTSIGSSAFSGCSSLTAITIPEGVTSIENSAFYGCSSLTAINIPEESQLTSIGRSAFYGCSSLTAINIPEGVTSIGELAFVGCSLESIIVDADNTVYDSRNGCNAIIETSSNTLITGCAKTVIPESVTSVGDYAFAECTGLTTIILPESVMSIGYAAFNGCSSLTAITIPEGSKLTTIERLAFRDCSSLTSIILPKSVTEIEFLAFSGCSSLTAITIPESVTSIGGDAFRDCSSLTAIIIPEGVTSIGNYAFRGCTGLANIYCYAETVPSTEKYSFHQSNIGTATLHVPASALESYKTTAPWSSFGNIVTIGDMVTINQYGSGTYCSEYALDFSEVEGLKAYAATGYNTKTGIVTLTRVMTSKPGLGLFIKGEPGEYTVPVLEDTDDNSLNMFVGLTENTTITATSSDGLYCNFRYTIKPGEEAPLFYRVEEAGFTLGAGKAYLQIPAAWMPATEARSIGLRFDDEDTTDIEETEFTIQDSEFIFDLMGRRVDQPQKGSMYIVNGKKTIIK